MRILPRHAVLATVAVAAVFLTGVSLHPAAGPLRTPAAHAKESVAALKFFDAQWAKYSRSIASKAWDVANDARKSNLFQFAKEEAEFALRFDPDNKDAREYLCYGKKKKGWELDTDKASKLQALNSKNQKESQKSFDKKIEKWKEKRAKVRAYIADKYVQLGNQCASKGYAEQAKKGYQRALDLDRDSKGARKGLGFTKIGKVWLTAKQHAAVKAATGGEWVKEHSDLEKGLGTSLNKIQSLHFRLEDDKDAKALPTHIKALETMYAYLLADFGVSPLNHVFKGADGEPGRVEMCVVSQKPLWEKWVDEFSGFHDKPWLKDSNTYRNYTHRRCGILRVETAEHVDTRDPLLHHAAHLLAQELWHTKKHAWLDEGLAYYYTVKVQETTRTHCVEKYLGGYAQNEEQGGDKDWTASEGWRHLLKGMVKTKNDMELRTLLNKKLGDLQIAATVKGWGVISWLMDRERDKFQEFLRTVRDTDEPQADALQRIFGRGVEDIDKEWRAYALRAF